jgi:hypothetical protein
VLSKEAVNGGGIFVANLWRSLFLAKRPNMQPAPIPLGLLAPFSRGVTVLQTGCNRAAPPLHINGQDRLRLYGASEKSGRDSA